MIQDAVSESLVLDYKEAINWRKEKRKEIGKDISAFANTEGGMLIYGMKEEKNIPIKITPISYMEGHENIIKKYEDIVIENHIV